MWWWFTTRIVYRCQLFSLMLIGFSLEEKENIMLGLSDKMEILEIQDLNVKFTTPIGEVYAVNNASFTLNTNETLAFGW